MVTGFFILGLFVGLCLGHTLTKAQVMREYSTNVEDHRRAMQEKELG